MLLRKLVSDMYQKMREDIFNSEYGQVAYSLLEKNPDIDIPDCILSLGTGQSIEVLRCIDRGDDPYILLSQNFSYSQMREINAFMVRKIDPSIILNVDIGAPVMKEVRKAIQEGIKVDDINLEMYNIDHIKILVSARRQGINDITALLNTKLRYDELLNLKHKMIKKLNNKDVSIEKYKNIHRKVIGPVD